MMKYLLLLLVQSLYSVEILYIVVPVTVNTVNTVNVRWQHYRLWSAHPGGVHVVPGMHAGRLPDEVTKD